ncbi:carbohydrate sulfotransferase 14-like [Diadema setosum]|uniref:carbohydrate sulfotransferase 14-like n=1 Tax=Diadema setosum TaxID=31175 RepID=UPI003B3B5E30
MSSRRTRLHEACSAVGSRKLDYSSPSDVRDVTEHRGNLDTMLFNDKFRFISAVIFKCGSSNWRRFLMSLAEKQGRITNLPPQLARKQYKPKAPLSFFSKNQVHELTFRLRHYTKIVTVRHPLIRFLSGYRDKFIEHTDKFRKDIPAKILKARSGKVGPRHVTFPEFAGFVTKNNWTRGTDPHWTPQYIRSRPCEHDYDIIVKLETSQDDMAFLQHELGIEKFGTYQKEYEDRHRVSNDKKLIVSFYHQLTEELFHRVCDYYSLDFMLFGYYRPKSIADVEKIFDDFA